MSWAYVHGVWNSESGSGITLDCDSGGPSGDGVLVVAAGDLIVAVARWDGTDPTGNKIEATSGNVNTFTLKAVQDESQICMVMGYKLIADVNATATFRLTVGGNRTYRAMYVMQFRPDGGETTTLTAGPNPATAANGQPVSGAIDPAGDDIVVLGGISVYNYGFGSHQIGGVGADAALWNDNLGGIWYKLYTSEQGSMTADVTWDSSEAEWVCDILGFKSAAAGPGGIVLPIIDHHNRMMAMMGN